jgi:hypothetical protein
MSCITISSNVSVLMRVIRRKTFIANTSPDDIKHKHDVNYLYLPHASDDSVGCMYEN